MGRCLSHTEICSGMRDSIQLDLKEVVYGRKQLAQDSVK
jgi:hypothetical protein